MLLPLKQGLKPLVKATPTTVRSCYATSIKTRIETFLRRLCSPETARVVMLLPLKQGLKRWLLPSRRLDKIVVMLLPLKQGLKQGRRCSIRLPLFVVMLLPLKQGLKLSRRPRESKGGTGCYATSIKTRIETGFT